MVEPHIYDAILASGNHQGYLACIVLAVIIGSYFLFRDSQEWNLSEKKRHRFFRYLGLISLIGAAIPAYFAGGWVGQLAWHQLIGPKTILGGMIASMVFAIFYKKKTGMNQETGDAFARGGCLMMLIGRIGCVIQHCCFGIVTNHPLGIDYGLGEKRVPTQLMEAFILFAIFISLQVMHHHKLFPLRRLYIFFLLYGSSRFILEFYREPIASNYLGLDIYQWLAGAIAVIGCIQLIRANRYVKDQAMTNTQASSIAYTF